MYLVHSEDQEQLTSQLAVDRFGLPGLQGSEGQPLDGGENICGRGRYGVLLPLVVSRFALTAPLPGIGPASVALERAATARSILYRALPAMKAMVLAAGLGTRLRPITYELPKPMVPVLDRPVMGHIVGMLERQGFDELVANLHYFPDEIKGYFGSRLTYRYEPELLGTAGGVRNAADFFGDEPVVVVSGDALTDLDLNTLVERHRSAGGVATLTVKKVPDTREYGVVIHDAEGRVQGFQEKPDPAEALSDLGNCGIYCFSAEIFDYFPDGDPVDWAQDVFPVLLDNDVPFYVHEIDAYWNDVGSLDELRQGTWDALDGKLGLAVSGSSVVKGVTFGEGSDLDDVEIVSGPVWVGAGVSFGSDVRLIGPVAIGDGSTVGDGVALRDSIVFPGTDVAAGEILIGAIRGGSGIIQRARPLEALGS